MAEDRVATYIRVKVELYEILKDIAKSEHRSLNQQIEHFLLASAESYLKENPTA